MKISRTVTYALQATLQLAQAGGETPVPCSRLAAQGDMPERFLLQILRSLVTHGILRSTRGVDGGYVLKRGPDQISILDVIEAIEGPIATHEVAIGNGIPAESRSKLTTAFAQVATTTRQQLEAVKLSQLIPPKQRKNPAKNSVKNSAKNSP